MHPTPTPQQETPAGQALPSSGELARWPLLYLYYLAASRLQTGRLALRLSDRVITVDFRKGAPIAVTSNHPDDALLPFLLRSGALDAQRVAQARAQNPAFDQGDVTTALIASRLLDPQQLYGHLLQRAHALLLTCMVSDGSFVFGPLPAEPQQGFPLGDRWGLLTALVRLLPAIGIRHRLAPVWERPLMKTGGHVDVADLKLNPQETRALSRVNGVHSLAQLTREHPTEAEALMRVAFLLRHLEAITFLPASQASAGTGVPPAADVGTAHRTSEPVGAQTGVPPIADAASPSRAAEAPSRVPAGATPPPSASPLRGHSPVPGPARAARPVRAVAKATPPPPQKTETLQELRALRERMYAQNHFERLGVATDAPGSAAKLAYFKLARRHHPDTVAHDADAEVKKLQADIFAAVGEAYRILSDDGARADYIAELASGGEIDVQAIMQAEELFTRATLLVKNRRFPDALKILDEAVSLNPEEGEFYAWRAWCRFLSQPDRTKPPTEVLEDLDAANRLSPRCVAAHHYRGSIARLVGNTSEAKVHFEKALELQPDHVEAARELRILTGKR